MSDALVFAGNSFIGRHLCRGLNEAGAEVVVAARSVNAHPGAWRGDLNNADDVDRAVAAVEPRWVFQCAGATQGAQAWAMFGLHLNGTLNVLAAMRAMPRRQRSSCSAAPPNTAIRRPTRCR
jgi:nucleoside-diphosphate-sugar epimerase